VLVDIYLTNFVCCHLPYHTNRMGMSHSTAAATASTPLCTRRAPLGLESVSCDALWLFQSSLLQCQRGAWCQPTEVWLQKGLARDQTATEGHDGSRLPQNMGKIIFHNKPQPHVYERQGSPNEPSRWLHLSGKKSYGTSTRQQRKMESGFKQYKYNYLLRRPFLTHLGHSHHHISDSLH